MSGRVEPFWQMPRWLVRAVDDGRLSPFAFSLLCYLGGAGLEHHGASVTLSGLAGTFKKSTKWISTSLRNLREAQLIEYDLQPGQRHPFRVTAGKALRDCSLFFEPTSELSSELEATSELTSELTSVCQFRGHLGSGEGGDVAQAQAESGDAAIPTSEVEALSENETETKSKPLSHEERLVPSRSEGTQDARGALDRARAAAEKLALSETLAFADELPSGEREIVLDLVDLHDARIFEPPIEEASSA